MFLKYIKKLNLTFLSNHGPLKALVEGAASVLDGTRDDILKLRDFMLPETAPLEYLEKIASSRKIKRLPGEDNEKFRARVTYAYLFWKKGHNKKGINEALSFFNKNIKIDDPQWPFLDISTDYLTPDEATFIKWLVNEVKPARSKIKNFEAVSENKGIVYVGSVTSTKQVVTVMPFPA